MFDALRAKYEESDHYLSPAAAIIQSPSFESGICKLIEENEDLTEEEKKALSSFLIEHSEEERQGSFAERILKNPRLKKYQDARYIPATSNHDEKFFSSCKLVISDLRMSMFPKNLEIIMFLKCNRDLWDVKLLAIMQ